MIRITSRNIHSTFTPKSKVLYALNYKYVPDVLNRRNEPWNPQEKGGMLIRDAHIEFLEPFQKAGSVMLGGAFNPPDAGALMVLNMASEEEVNNFVSFLYHQIK